MPYRLRELLARVASLVRRKPGAEGGQRFGVFKVDEAARTVSRPADAVSS